MITQEEIMFIREQSLRRILAQKEDDPINPSWKYRVAMAGTKAPYNFERARKRRKMQKQSRKINRRK